MLTEAKVRVSTGVISQEKIIKHISLVHESVQEATERFHGRKILEGELADFSLTFPTSPGTAGYSKFPLYSEDIKISEIVSNC